MGAERIVLIANEPCDLLVGIGGRRFGLFRLTNSRTRARCWHHIAPLMQFISCSATSRYGFATYATAVMVFGWVRGSMPLFDATFESPTAAV
jgi:hypothetical protein